jgi:hypothetical protein
LTQQDLDNEYLTMPPNIWGVNSIMNFGSTTSSSVNIFDVQYQLRQTDVQNFINTSLIYYDQVMSHLALVEHMLVTQRQYRFNRNSDKVYIDMNWKLLTVDSYVVLDCYAVIDPTENTKFWNNLTFKKMAVAKFKKMWSMAYSKFDNITLAGGATVNGKEMYNLAHNELEEIEANIINNQSPLGFFVG